jgi:hypothetical protein
VSPKKGLTLIWPADWTFTHRGVPSPTQEKIITTGWSRAVLEINRNDVGLTGRFPRRFNFT